MNEPAYPFRISDDALDYRFESVSEQKIIHKVVEFRSFPNNPIFYNLALLDFEEDGTLNDLVVSNNHDMARILATVFQSMLVFFKSYPNKLVYFKGSDEVGLRTRLYRILISRELEQVRKLFETYGQLADNSFEEFMPDRPYIAFIFQLKNSK